MESLKTLIFASFIALAGLVSVPATAQQATVYSQAELDQMLAPIALYPDTVLSHVLIAATYPLEIVQAARWSRNNPGITGQAAVDMVENQNWDPSVKALVAFPELLARMDQDINWTQNLGDAFLAQEGEVTDTIQYLRNEAYNNGQLKSNQQVNVVRETRYIYIEPAQPQVVYVPYYDPRIIYGGWRYPAYPPVYWHHPPGWSVSLGFYWGVGFNIQTSFFFSSFYWPSRHVVVVDHHYHNYYPYYGYRKGHGHYRPGYHMSHYDGAKRWKHDYGHRRGVSYRGDVDRDRFSNHQGDWDDDRYEGRDGDRDRNGDGGRGGYDRGDQRGDDSGGRSRDYAGADRTVRTRDQQRDWADRQRSQFADNGGNFRGGNRSRDSSGNDRGRGQQSAGERGRTPEQDNRVVDNSAANRGATRSTGSRGDAREEFARNTDRSIERLRRDLENSGATRRPGSQTPAARNEAREVARSTTRNPNQDTARNNERAKQRETNRSVLPAPDSQPAVTWRDDNTSPAREPRATADTRNRRVVNETRAQDRQVNLPRESRQMAAGQQRPERAAGVNRPERSQVQPKRQDAPQRQAAPAREAAPVYHAKVDRGANQDRGNFGQRTESRQYPGKVERSNQGGGNGDGSRGRERNSRD
jgi:hypothetical protein